MAYEISDTRRGSRKRGRGKSVRGSYAAKPLVVGTIEEVVMIVEDFIVPGNAMEARAGLRDEIEAALDERREFSRGEIVVREL